MQHLFFLAFLLFMVSHPSFAGDCGPVNLITEDQSPFEKIPVYDQKDTNICYAYSAAQMLDYYLMKKGAPERSVHPAWMALNYALSKGRTGLDIGHPKEAIESLRGAKNCDYNAIADALINWGKPKDLSETGVIGFIEKTSRREYLLSPVEMISTLLREACAPERRSEVSLPLVGRYNFNQLPDDSHYEQFIKQRLTSSSSPISIAYCSKVWKKPDYDGIELTSSNVRDVLKKDCDYHESLVVGKKLIENSCHFLVRNTWGTKWRKANKNWKCLCRNKGTGEFVDECESIAHTNENFSVEACWIPSASLSKNIGVITVLE